MGRSTSIVVRLPSHVFVQVGRLAEQAATTKSAMVAELVEKALSAVPETVDAAHHEAELTELVEIRGEYERANAALDDIHRQLSMLSIRLRAFSGAPDIPGPPQVPPTIDEPPATQVFHAEPTTVEVAPRSPWAPPALPFQPRVRTIDEILSTFAD